MNLTNLQAPSKLRNPYHQSLSLTGTFSTHGSHFHITVTDQNGKASGGHLKEGAIVRTTAEIVILEPEDVIFMRETDIQTGYKELKIVPK